MKTLERVAAQPAQFSSSLNAILEAAENISRLSDSELRERIDDVHSFLVERFLAGADTEELDDVTRLVGKLEALRERLLYSYFGQGQLRSLQEVLYDLHTAIELHTTKGRHLS